MNVHDSCGTRFWIFPRVVFHALGERNTMTLWMWGKTNGMQTSEMQKAGRPSKVHLEWTVKSWPALWFLEDKWKHDLLSQERKMRAWKTIDLASNHHQPCMRAEPSWVTGKTSSQRLPCFLHRRPLPPYHPPPPSLPFPRLTWEDGTH